MMYWIDLSKIRCPATLLNKYSKTLIEECGLVSSWRDLENDRILHVVFKKEPRNFVASGIIFHKE